MNEALGVEEEPEVFYTDSEKNKEEETKEEKITPALINLYIPGQNISEEKTNFVCERDMNCRLELSETYCYMTDSKPTGANNLTIPQFIIDNSGNFEQ